MRRATSIFICFALFLSVCISLLSCGIIAPEDRPNEHPPALTPGGLEQGGAEWEQGGAMLGETSLIGIAAYAEFDIQAAKGLSGTYRGRSYSVGALTDNEDGEGENYLKISYPYDYVKILSAYKFSVNITDIADTVAKEIIEESCGLGEVEVVVADFETYLDDNGQMVRSVCDTLISLRGVNGYYTVLVNSGMSEQDGFMHVFSSHKKLTDEEVSKDFTPPILSIFLKEEGEARYVYFETSDNLLSFGSYDQGSAAKNTTKVQTVSRNSLYSVLELTKLPTVEVEATVLEIDAENGVIKVGTQTRLVYVYVSEYTEGLGIQDVTLGQTLIVEYDLLFDRYDPKSVTASSITAAPQNEGEA